MNKIKCDICLTPKTDKIAMISSRQNKNICERCIVDGYEIMKKQKINIFKDKTIKDMVININKKLTPHLVKDYLDEHVIGQEETKKVLSVALSSHYKRLYQNKIVEDNNIILEKSNVLIIGPTGSGKTYLTKNLTNLINEISDSDKKIPFTIANAPAFTENGYKGDDIESIIGDLVEMADGNVEMAETGIVFIDEIDKICTSGDLSKHGTSVQKSILKMIEGSVVNVNKKNNSILGGPEQKIKVNTDNILFILGGAFIGLEEIIEKRINGSNKSIGFLKENKGTYNQKILEQIITEDIISYGFIPEFIGRISNISMLKELTEEDLIHILTKPKNAIIKQYKKIFEIDGVELEFDKESLTKIAKGAIFKKTGARGLRSILDKTLLNYMFDIATYKSKTIKINAKEIDFFNPKQKNKQIEKQ